MTYLIDADVLIQAKNRHYGFDFCPAFWDWLDAAHAAGRVSSVARVRDEVFAGADELADWARARDSFFLSPDDSVVTSMRAVAAWANSATPRYVPAAITTFLAAADYYLVAQAHADGFTVVTAEVAADSLKKIKIPNACAAMSVPHMDVFTMLRVESARFVMP